VLTRVGFRGVLPRLVNNFMPFCFAALFDSAFTIFLHHKVKGD